MAVRAGRLRHRVRIEQRADVQDPDTGAMVHGWAPVMTLWAAVEPLSAREFIAAQSEQSKVVARITVRHVAGIDASMRAVHGSTVYNIEGVLADADSGREYLTLPVSAGVREG